MNKIRLDPGDDVIYDFPLEGHADQHVFPTVIGVDLAAIVENPVFGQMETFIWHLFLNCLQFALQSFRNLVVEHGPVVGQRHMHICPLLKKGADQGGGNVRQPAGLGGQVVAHISHAIGQVGNFRGDDQNPGIFTAGRHVVLYFPVC